MVILTEGDFIWIEDCGTNTPIGAEVRQIENEHVFVVDDEGREKCLNETTAIRVMHPSSIDGVEDMIDLGDLHEASVLRNLLIRSRDQKHIYTFIGSVILAVNPHQQLNIYTIDFVRSYHTRRIGELPAHIFAIAESAHARISKHQFGHSSVILSGEAGSGKTESSKLILHYLTTVCGQHSFVEQQLLEANTIIEAFGNASTLYNDNSSRFGKYTRVFFDQEGRVKGARLSKFLLEKSRVVQHGLDERNFHIFYMLFNLSQKEKLDLELQQPVDYHLLNQGKNVVEGRDDRNELKLLRESLNIMSFTNDEVWQIFSVLAALLHFGNLKYNTSIKDNMEVTEVDDLPNINRVSKYLQIDGKQLTKVLTTQSMVVGKETVRRHLTTRQSLDQRDSLIKAVYNQLFEYIIEFINETLGVGLLNAENSRSIGILDIFGFENLPQNSFEQFCINYSNEILQQHFIRQIYKLEQADYESQQIGWQHLDYIDNQPVINLMAGSHLGIFQLIDEESVFPQGNDISLLQKLHSNHSKNSTSEYLKPSSDLIKSFGIRHYVGGFVSYSIDGFLAKNRDHFGNDLRHLIGTSKSKLIRKIFNCANHPLLQTQAEIQKQTVGQSFRKSLETLVAELENTDPLFVRCIRPNDKKLPNVFDRSSILRQLRNFGIIETLQIRSSGYAIRYDYKTFVDTYYGLVPNLSKSNYIEASRIILTIILGCDADFKLGKTKIFLKNNDDVFLQREREKMLNFYATSIQKNLLAYSKRRQYLAMRRSALVIQTKWRAYYQRKKYRQILDGIKRLQSILRSHQLVATFNSLRERICYFQAFCRGALIRMHLKDGEFLKERSHALIMESDSNEDISRKDESVNERLDRFAAVYLQNNEDFRHTTKILRQPLFEHLNVGDQMAALSIWIQILRFMCDLPEPESDYKNGSDMTTPIMVQLYSKIYKNKSKTMLTNKSEKSLFKNVESYDTFSRSSSKCSISTTTHTNNWFSNAPLSPLDRAHLIIGYGILRSSLRDEIFAQLMKQLTNNPKEISRERGLMLFSMCLGCIQPSENFAPYVQDFISTLEPVKNSLMERFNRCAQKGTRRQPPSYLEFQTAKNGKSQFVVNVTFMDGQVKAIEVDSSTTAQEVCIQLAKKIDLKDRFGFSLFITMNNKVSSLGAGNDFLLDAISQCEQEARCSGLEERNAQWRLFYRKELFSPWNNQSTDSISNSLIYEQIIRGIHYNEYRCSEQELAILAAQQFYVNQSGECDLQEPDELEKQIPVLLPEAILSKTKNSLDMEKWLQLIMNAFRKTFSSMDKPEIEAVKRDVCDFAMRRWPLLFSRFYEAYKFCGPPLPKNEVLIAINSTGFYVLDKEDREILIEAPFVKIMGVVSSLSKRMGTDAITIQLLNGDEYTFQSENAEDIRQLVVFFLDGLRKRSKHLFVPNCFRRANPDQKWISCKKGDLLRIVEKPDEFDLPIDCFYVLNVRTNEEGIAPKHQVHIIPCLNEPSHGLINEMRKQTELKSEESLETIQQIVPVYNNCTFDLVPLPIAHTLQKFAVDHFRPNDSPRELWLFSPEPLRRPLLKQTEPRIEVLEMCFSIMRFMGDIPIIEQFHPVELADQIFNAAIKMASLKDELYCYLMKQLTDNPNPVSEDKGWKLLWLASGLFAPSKLIHKELIQFLNTRKSPRTAQCITRLNKTLRCGQNGRKYPPHDVEVNAIFSRTTQIFHKVFFPDGTNEAVEVESSSKASDLCRQLGSILGFKSTDGFSLFVKLGDKAVSIPEEEFFFDFISQITQWSRQNQTAKQSNSIIAYQVIFMRKLWINVKPGWDLAADLFHYYQLIPKYLHGFYSISRPHAIKLAALILKAQTKDGKEPPFAHFQQIITDIVPKDLLKNQSVNEWKKQITAEYEKVTAESSLEAKVQFLTFISQWPTFGSAFFEVKQTSDPTMPPRVLIAINQNGVSLYNNLNKELIVTYPFKTIITWTAGNTYFHLTVGNIVKSSRLLVETTLGYKMEDLICSYIKHLLYESNRKPIASIQHNNV